MDKTKIFGLFTLLLHSKAACFLIDRGKVILEIFELPHRPSESLECLICECLICKSLSTLFPFLFTEWK